MNQPGLGGGVVAPSYMPKDCGFSPWSEHVWEATDQCVSDIDVSVYLFSPSAPTSSLSKINKLPLCEDFKKMNQTQSCNL